ncbi:MAG: DUF4810 domain-containing protein [Enterobacteriaceae bacterium]|jgi:hypothetical protein|nr:DUF4810 domain-containing protein [Enterobacteriaceae bacterium]
MKLKNSIITLLVVLFLGGCAQPSKNLYYWGDYQNTVYRYYQSDKVAPEQQIASLQEVVEKSKATNLPVPPGLHAHLGMLYSNTGHSELAITEFGLEKSLFPESAVFMDSLINKSKGSKK